MSFEKKVPIPFVTVSNASRYSSHQSEIIENAVFIPSTSPTATSPGILVPRVGKKSVLTSGLFDSNDEIQSVFYSNSIKRIILITSSKIILCYPNLTKITEISITNVTDLYPRFTDTYQNPVLYCQGKLYSVSKSTFTQITSSNIPTDADGYYQLSSLDFINGYVVASVRDTKQFIRSELNGTSFSDGINFQSTQSYDNIKSVVCLNKEIYVFSEKHTEYWWNAAVDADQPFSHQDGRVFAIGIKSDNSILLNSVVYNVSSDDDNTSSLFAWTSSGFEKLGIDYVDYLIQNSDKIRLTGSIENNLTYVHIILDDSEVWSFCVDTKCWSRRTNWYFKNCYSVDGQYFVVSKNNVDKIIGNTDNDDLITSSKTSQHFVSDGYNQFFNMVDIDFGGEPVGNVKLSHKDIGSEGGWKNNAFQVLSKIGDYNRARFQRLGMSRDRIFKVSWTNGIIRNVLIDMRKGSK